MITATVLLDSMSETRSRLTTFVLRYPRFIHSEFLTHRTFSRNSSSSRAIPVLRQLAAIRKDPVVPIHWGANQKGMQAYAEIDPDLQGTAEGVWKNALRHALLCAHQLDGLGVHKQIVNRLVEPFSYITVIATSTQAGLNNFYNLRRHHAAEPHIYRLADAMLDAQLASTPQELATGQWHLPFVSSPELLALGYEVALKVSVARCARVSYLTHDGERSVEKDLALYERLIQELHVSPFEHQAQALEDPNEASGNLLGWKQYRKTIANEFRPEFQP